MRPRAVVSGVSHGTELHLVRGSSPFTDLDLDPGSRRFIPRDPGADDGATTDDPLPGRPLGYEFVGEVVEVGPGALVHAEQVCVALGPELDIGYPAQVRPAGLDPEAAAFLSLAAVALFAVHDARIDLGDEVVVSGLGAIGLLVVQLTRASGASRVVGVDVVIETSGAPAALHEAIAAVRVAGTVISAGFVQGGASALRLGEEWHHNRPQLISSMGVWDCPHRAHPRWDRRRIAATALKLLAEGRLRTAPLISQRVPFDRAPRAYSRLAANPETATKVLLVS